MFDAFLLKELRNLIVVGEADGANQLLEVEHRRMRAAKEIDEVARGIESLSINHAHDCFPFIR
jgi:hypothetical protein